MINYTEGNLLEAEAEALVNTVNTVGVMGKGIALMFRERFNENFRHYAAACSAKEVRIGKMFVTEPRELDGPRWLINFPTKKHWRQPSKIEWIVEGLVDLRHFIVENEVRSIAIPPLGAGNGGLEWRLVRAEIERALGDLPIEIAVYEPSANYVNVRKTAGVERLTAARALIAEMIRRYCFQGFECTLLEAQKLAWFIERACEDTRNDPRPLDLQFTANQYGPYAQRLQHLLDSLDGSYLHAERRIADSKPDNKIWFDDSRAERLSLYLASVGQRYSAAIERVSALIQGFESPYGLELLSTVDWLLSREGTAPTPESVREALGRWHGGGRAAERKLRIFDDRAISVALERLSDSRSLAS